MNYWSNTPKFMVSLLKAWWGGAATKENDFAYHYLPKYEKPLAWNTIIDDMYHGKMEGLFLHGTNFHANSPHAHKVFKGLSNLKWLVIDDCFPIDTAEFWKSSPEVKPESIQTEVLLLPGLNFAEKDGTFVNSGRVLKWRWKGPEGPGDARDEKWVYGDLFSRLKTLFAKEKTKFPDPILHLAWAYKNPLFPTAEEVLAEMNGYALADLEDRRKKTACEKGRPSGHLRTPARRRHDVLRRLDLRGRVSPVRKPGGGHRDRGPLGFGGLSELRFFMARQPAHSLQPRLRRPSGKPWGPNKKYLWWSDADKRWTGVDIPDIGACFEA